MDIRYRGGRETISLLKTFYSAAYNAFNVYRRELAPGTVSLTGDRAQGDDSKHWANSRSNDHVYICLFVNIEIKTVGWHNQQSSVVLKTV